jgi:hypothetical protein
MREFAMAGDSEQIYSVTGVEVEVQKRHPPILVVRAKGETNTSGWTGAALSQVVYVDPPQDGIQDYTFVATPPSEGGLDVLTPVEAEDSWPDFEAWVRGVRVSAATNSIEEKIGGS